MDELKPCPFCGGEALMDVIGPHRHQLATFMPDYNGATFIECTKCTCAMSGKSIEEAANAWNHRTTI